MIDDFKLKKPSVLHSLHKIFHRAVRVSVPTLIELQLHILHLRILYNIIQLEMCSTFRANKGLAEKIHRDKRHRMCTM